MSLRAFSNLVSQQRSLRTGPRECVVHRSDLKIIHVEVRKPHPLGQMGASDSTRSRTFDRKTHRDD